MPHHRLTLLLVPGMLMLTLTVGCAKRPTVTAASAPPPTGTATTVTPPLAPAPLAPAAPAPVAPAPPVTVPPAAVTPPAPVIAARPAPPSEFAPSDALKPIHFDFDKSDIRKGDAEILRANAKWLTEHATHRVLIEGHCDARGTNEYNLALGERRAKAAMDFLASAGVAPARMTIVSYGEERPECQQEHERCWSRNRRAMFLTRPQ
jgi:peptidoglycan-associated lipoprotein